MATRWVCWGNGQRRVGWHEPVTATLASGKTWARLCTPVHHEKHVARHKAVAPVITDPVITEIIMIDVAKYDAVAAPRRRSSSG